MTQKIEKIKKFAKCKDDIDTRSVFFLIIVSFSAVYIIISASTEKIYLPSSAHGLSTILCDSLFNHARAEKRD